MAGELINANKDCHMGLVEDHGGHLINQPRSITYGQVLESNSLK